MAVEAHWPCEHTCKHIQIYQFFLPKKWKASERSVHKTNTNENKHSTTRTTTALYGLQNLFPFDILHKDMIEREQHHEALRCTEWLADTRVVHLTSLYMYYFEKPSLVLVQQTSLLCRNKYKAPTNACCCCCCWQIRGQPTTLTLTLIQFTNSQHPPTNRLTSQWVRLAKLLFLAKAVSQVSHSFARSQIFSLLLPFAVRHSNSCSCCYMFASSVVVKTVTTQKQWQFQLQLQKGSGLRKLN